MKVTAILTLLSNLVIFQGTPARASSGKQKQNSVETGVLRLNTRLLDIVSKRMKLMPDVAAWKHLNGKAIDDREREQQLLRILVARGASLDLEETFIREFFQEQFEAAKKYQKQYLKKNKDSLKTESVPDLINETRPKIAALTKQLLEILSKLATTKSAQRRVTEAVRAHLKTLTN